LGAGPHKTPVKQASYPQKRVSAPSYRTAKGGSITWWYCSEGRGSNFQTWSQKHRNGNLGI